MITQIPRLFLLLCLAAPDFTEEEKTGSINLTNVAISNCCQFQLLKTEVDIIYADLDLTTPAYCVDVNWCAALVYLRTRADNYAMPPSADVYRLPSADICRKTYEFAEKFCERISEEERVCQFWDQTERASQLRRMREHVQSRMQIWMWLICAHDLKAANGDRGCIRGYLSIVRSQVGDEVYYNGQLPFSVPLEYFVEKR